MWKKKVKLSVLDKVKTFVTFVKKNKEIWVLAYLIWITTQVIILLLILWFTWLNYISITFSLVLFIIILSLFFLSITSFIILFIWVFFLLIAIFFNVWILGKAIFILLLGFLFLIKYLDLFEDKRKEFSKKYWEKIDRFYVKYFIFLFLLLFLFMIIATFSFKVAIIKYGDNKEVYWKYLFYNQDYYFLDICWKKLIIPANKVESIEIKTESYKFSSMKADEKNSLNEDYNKFCEKYLKNDDSL